MNKDSLRYAMPVLLWQVLSDNFPDFFADYFHSKAMYVMHGLQIHNQKQP